MDTPTIRKWTDDDGDQQIGELFADIPDGTYMLVPLVPCDTCGGSGLWCEYYGVPFDMNATPATGRCPMPSPCPEGCKGGWVVKGAE